MASFYIFSDLGTEGVAIEAPADYELRLTAWLRTRTKPLNVRDVADALGGQPIATRRATATIKIAKMALTIQKGEDMTYMRVHDDRKPGINNVADFRSRPKPFLMDGSCRG